MCLVEGDLVIFPPNDIATTSPSLTLRTKILSNRWTSRCLCIRCLCILYGAAV